MHIKRDFIRTFGVLAVSALTLMTGCKEDRSYVIEGTIYGGRNFEDQPIYLVPLSGASADRIDSATIHDSRFRFDGEALHDEVYIIRMRPMMRLFVDELTIVREPGHIRTRISQDSQVAGTPLNDSLQAWQNFRGEQENVIRELKKSMKRARNQAESDRLQAQLDSVSDVFYGATRRSATANENNALGEYLRRFLK